MLPLHVLFRVAIALRVAATIGGRAPSARGPAAHLRLAAHALPDVSRPDLVDAIVDAAIDVQTPRVPAALIVAIAWGESRFEASARPACGVLQVFPRDLAEPAAACDVWRRDLRAGVRAGVREIETMLADKRVRGDLRRALLYRACGNRAFDGSCSPAKHAWVAAALARWRDLARPSVAGS